MNVHLNTNKYPPLQSNLILVSKLNLFINALTCARVCGMQLYVVLGTANDERSLHRHANDIECDLRYLKYHIKSVLNLHKAKFSFYL